MIVSLASALVASLGVVVLGAMLLGGFVARWH